MRIQKTVFSVQRLRVSVIHSHVHVYVNVNMNRIFFFV